MRPEERTDSGGLENARLALERNVNDVIRSTCLRHGTPEAAAGISLQDLHWGEMIVTRPVERMVDRNKIQRELTLRLDATKPFNKDRLEREVGRHVRRHLREKAIAGHDEPPAWSYTIHRMARAWMLSSGVDPMTVVAMIRQGRPEDLRIHLEQQGLHIEGIVIEDGRVDFSVLSNADGRRDVQMIGLGKPALLADVEVPETIMSSLDGRKVIDVLRADATVREGRMRIEKAHMDVGLLTLALPDVQAHLRRPPKGADTRWNRIDFKPHPSG